MKLVAVNLPSTHELIFETRFRYEEVHLKLICILCEIFLTTLAVADPEIDEVINIQ